MTTAVRHPPGTAIVAATVVLIVAAIVAVAWLGTSGVAEYEPGTPEAAAQTYLQALLDDDAETAHALLTPLLQQRCEAAELLLGARTDMDRAVFEDVTIEGNSAVIDMRVTWADYSPDPLLPRLSRDDFETRLVLERISGEWRIAGADWPLGSCDWR